MSCRFRLAEVILTHFSVLLGTSGLRRDARLDSERPGLSWLAQQVGIGLGVLVEELFGVVIVAAVAALADWIPVNAPFHLVRDIGQVAGGGGAVHVFDVRRGL